MYRWETEVAKYLSWGTLLNRIHGPLKESVYSEAYVL